MSQPIYLGSQTLIDRDGTWVIEHRDHHDALTCTDVIGDRLALNYQLLGITPPTSSLTSGNTNPTAYPQVTGGGGDPSTT